MSTATNAISGVTCATCANASVKTSQEPCKGCLQEEATTGKHFPRWEPSATPATMADAIRHHNRCYGIA